MIDFVLDDLCGEALKNPCPVLDSLILIPDGNIEEIKGRVSLMKKLANNYDNVSFAVGYCVDEDSRNVRQAMKLADELMYKDKEEFYKLHPEKRRV